MAVMTAAQLVVELAKRMGEYATSNPTSAGTTLTLIDTALNQIWPQNVGGVTSPFGVWVYGTTTADASNRGVERRASRWSADTSTLTFLTAWPAAPSTGAYEIHQRHARGRKLEAINEAIGILGMNWYRDVLDEASITTAVNTWQYTLPSTVNWRHVRDLQLQVNTTAGFSGYPYDTMEDYDWAILPFVDAAGNTTWRLQFSSQPPPNRKIRILGQAEYTDLVADTDVLPLRPDQQRTALAWLYRYATALLQRWEALKQPASQVARLEQQIQTLTAEAEALRGQYAPPNRSSRIIVPGKGTGTFTGQPSDSSWLGAFGSTH